MAYIGKSPDGTGVRSRFYYTQTSGGGTSVSGSSDDGTSLAFSDGAYVDVFLNGVLLVAGTDYNTSTANTIAGLAALANGDVVEVVVYDIFTVADTVSSLNGGAFSGAVTVPQLNADNIRIDGNTISSTDTNGDITLDPNGTGDTIVASGNLGINTASPSKVLDVRDNDATGTTTSSNRVALFATNGTGKDAHITFSNLVDSPASIGNKGALYFDYNNTERMRITSGGEVLIGTTSGGSSSRLHLKGAATLCVMQNDDANGGTYQTTVLFRNSSGTPVGTIKSNSTSVAYNSASDYRLKENVADMTGAIARVKTLAPKRFNFIADADTTVDGFLAHEAQTVVPEAVSGTHNEVDEDGNAIMQGIDQSKLVPLLTGALKEAIAKIETLETKVAALEAE